MIGFPSNVLVVTDYKNPHFTENILKKVDFVLSCGDVEFAILEEIYQRFNKPVFAVKGNHDTNKPFPPFVLDIHLRIVQHRNWLIGGFAGVPSYQEAGPYEWDEQSAADKLDKFPYVDIFICHAPLLKIAANDDYAHTGREALRRYIDSRQPKFVYHGHVYDKMGAMLGETAVVSVYGAEVFSLSY